MCVSHQHPGLPASPPAGGREGGAVVPADGAHEETLERTPGWKPARSTSSGARRNSSHSAQGSRLHNGDAKAVSTFASEACHGPVAQSGRLRTAATGHLTAREVPESRAPHKPGEGDPAWPLAASRSSGRACAISSGALCLTPSSPEHSRLSAHTAPSRKHARRPG